MLCFQVLVPDAAALGTKQLPAPSAQTWKAVAEVLSKGMSTLGPVKTWSIVIGGLVGLLLPLLAGLFPKYAKWVPSPAGLGLAWTFQWSTACCFSWALLGYGFENRAVNRKNCCFRWPRASWPAAR